MRLGGIFLLSAVTLFLCFPLVEGFGAPAASDPKALALMQAAAANFEKLKTVQADIGQVLTKGPSLQRFGGSYVASSPGRIHIQYTYPYIQDVVSDGVQLWWYIPNSKKVWHLDDMKALFRMNEEESAGAAPFSTVGFENVDLKPKPDVYYTLEDSLWSKITGTWKITFAGNKAAAGLKGTFWLDRKLGLPDKVEFLSEKGEVALRQTFEDYIGIKNLFVPQKVMVEFPKNKFSLYVEYSNVRVNEAVQDSLFRFTTPQGVPVVPFPSLF